MKRLGIRYTNRTLVLILLFITIISMGLLTGYAKSRSDVGEKSGSATPGYELSKRDVPFYSPGKSTFGAGNRGSISKAVLAVEGMSCSGCISTIKASLTDMKGIREIVVDLTGGRAQIYFDPKELKDTHRIAENITASGYPAR